MRATVSFQDPPRPRIGTLGLFGEGLAWIEDDALVLQGDVARRTLLVWGSLATWLVGLAVCAWWMLARDGDLEHPPTWLIALCIGLTGAGVVTRIVASKMHQFRTIRFPWTEIRAAFPMGLSMRLVTSRGESVLLGLGPSGPAELHRLGETIVRYASGPCTPSQSSRSRVKWWALGFALVLGGVVSLAIWDKNHPALYVDNASREPIDLWVDGVRVQTIAPNLDGKHPTSVRVRIGKHRLGHAPQGTARPATEVDADVGFGALFNPDSGACYWRRVVLYTPTNGVGNPHHERALTSSDGPLTIQPFYNLGYINHWFSDPPETVTFGKSESSMSRTALVRNGVCTDLAVQGCPMTVRTQLVSCQTIATTQAEVDRCAEVAVAACPRGANGSL